jgi:hypothetical protein
MRILVTKYKKKKRKALHVLFLRETIAELNNIIVRDVISADFQENKNIIICHSRLQNKAKLLKRYNRRLKLILY